MRTKIHPKNYRIVVLKDMSNENFFLCKSTADTKDSIKIDDIEYPLIKMEVSNTSHPFFTGKKKFIDSSGRVDKFMNRYKKSKK